MKTKIWFKTKNQAYKYCLKHFRRLYLVRFDKNSDRGFGGAYKHYFIEVEE